MHFHGQFRSSIAWLLLNCRRNGADIFGWHDVAFSRSYAGPFTARRMHSDAYSNRYCQGEEGSRQVYARLEKEWG